MVQFQRAGVGLIFVQLSEAPPGNGEVQLLARLPLAESPVEQVKEEALEAARAANIRNNEHAA